MTYRVDISIPALQDAETAFLWIRDFDPDAAKIWYEGLLDAVFSLEKFPSRCPTAPESKFPEREIKQIVYGNRQTYRIFFENLEKDKTVRIYRIWHSSRNWLTKQEFDEANPRKD